MKQLWVWGSLATLIVIGCGGPAGAPEGGDADGGEDVAAEPCVPTTCAAKGAMCGSIDDGCGTILDCGGCASPETCGGGGIRNVCGSSVAPPVILAGAGDIAGCSNDNDEATAVLLDRIFADPVAATGFVFTAGDNVYPNGTATEFSDCYGPTWGRHLARTRPAAGNHEYNSASAAPYYAYFGAVAGTAGEGWYSYDAGDWHVVVVNSNCFWLGGCTPASAQYRFLDQDLRASRAQCTLAYFHHPRFSNGTHGSQSYMDPIWQLLYEAGVDVVVAGHDHNYQRFSPQGPLGEADAARGVREFVVGTGGRSHYGPISPSLPNSEVTNDDTYGVLKLTLYASSYDWEFIPVDGATFTDAGSDVCH